MHTTSVALLVVAAATVAVVHSVLPDHWVPLAVVGRSQRWSLLRVARISALASAGHAIASLVLAGIVVLIGLRYLHQVEVQQGRIVGTVLVVTGIGFLIWGLAGHTEAHHHVGHDHDDRDDPHAVDPHAHGHIAASEPADLGHEHEHEHGGVRHSHRHAHEAFILERERELIRATQQRSLPSRMAAIAVPFGVAASPDLTILPVALAASAISLPAVVWVLATFVVMTMATFVGLTTGAAAVGYQMEGLWLERHANTITSAVLIAVGLVAFVGL
jgi:hypothetical protein